jgi:hypothetical protein
MPIKRLRGFVMRKEYIVARLNSIVIAGVVVNYIRHINIKGYGIDHVQNYCQITINGF